MLANQSDFMAYAGAFKSNYRKGVHRLETILSNPTHAAEFAANLGGVSVVLGVPIELPDRNSDKLLELLLGSTVADDAVLTWMHQFYEFTDWDDLLSDSARCKEMANNPLIWRAAGGSKLAVGKSIATLAGLSCSAYKDIDAVVASSTAMTAVAASSTAMAAVAASSTAMAAIIANATALNAVVTSSTAMAAIVAAPVAMAALWRSDTAIKALQANATAWKTFTGASSSVMGKTVAILAGLNPSSYADMTAIAASSTAMAAVAASSTAMTAIQKSPTALNAIAASSMATAKYAAGAAGLNPADYADMKAVAASSTAMAAVAASSTAMTAIANAWNVTESAIAGSTVALNALKNSGKCQNVTKDIRGAVTASFVSGLCFVFTAEITVSGGRCYIKAARPTGSNELTLCDAVKSVTVNKFCKNPYVQCTDSSHTYEKNKLYFYKIG